MIILAALRGCGHVSLLVYFLIITFWQMYHNCALKQLLLETSISTCYSVGSTFPSHNTGLDRSYRGKIFKKIFLQNKCMAFTPDGKEEFYCNRLQQADHKSKCCWCVYRSDSGHRVVAQRLRGAALQIIRRWSRTSQDVEIQYCLSKAGQLIPYAIV